MKNLKKDTKAVLAIYIVFIIALIAVGAFAFIFSTAIGQVQSVINPELASSNWATTDHYDAFALAATFVNNLWILFPALLVIGLLYWGYVEAQRRND